VTQIKYLQTHIQARCCPEYPRTWHWRHDPAGCGRSRNDRGTMTSSEPSSPESQMLRSLPLRSPAASADIQNTVCLRPLRSWSHFSLCPPKTEAFILVSKRVSAESLVKMHPIQDILLKGCFWMLKLTNSPKTLCFWRHYIGGDIKSG